MIKLQKQDIDQQVKQNSIIAMCQLVSIAHANLPQAAVDGLVQILRDRLTNELTRQAALRGLIILATNPTGKITM